MGIYRGHVFRNYKISQEEYGYLLPIYGKCAKDFGFIREVGDPSIIEKNGKYFFCGTAWDYKEMKER